MEDRNSHQAPASRLVPTDLRNAMWLPTTGTVTNRLRSDACRWWRAKSARRFRNRAAVGAAVLTLLALLGSSCGDDGGGGGECSSRNQCPADQVCRNSFCTAPNVDGTCASDQECIRGQVCTNNFCTAVDNNNGVPCGDRTDCAGLGQVCGRDGFCRAATGTCTGDDECLAPDVCIGGSCVDDPTNNNNENNNNEDRTPPMVTGIIPMDGTEDVPVTSAITINFSENIRDNLLEEAISLEEAADQRAVPFTVTHNGDSLTVTPSAPLRSSTPYLIRVFAELFDEAGNRLAADARATFSTQTLPEANYATLAEMYAPYVYQEIEDGSTDRVDYFTSVDFDGNWNAADNFMKYRSMPNPGTVYYNVIESATHYFIQYLWYYAANYNDNSADTAPHDVVASQVVVAKASAEFVMVESCYQSSCNGFAATGRGVGDGAVGLKLEFDPADLADGRRFRAYHGSGFHGGCHWLWQPGGVDIGTAPWCNHNPEEFRNDARSLLYYPGSMALGPTDLACNPGGCSPDDGVVCNDTECIDSSGQRSLTYVLADIRGTLFVRRAQVGPDQLYDDTGTYNPHETSGNRPGLDEGRTFPASFASDDNDARGRLPFDWVPGGGGPSLSPGQWWVDPAYAFSGRYNFDEPYADIYCYNTYLGIDIRGSSAQCP